MRGVAFLGGGTSGEIISAKLASTSNSSSALKLSRVPKRKDRLPLPAFSGVNSLLVSGRLTSITVPRDFEDFEKRFSSTCSQFEQRIYINRLTCWTHIRVNIIEKQLADDVSTGTGFDRKSAI